MSEALYRTVAHLVASLRKGQAIVPGEESRCGRCNHSHYLRIAGRLSHPFDFSFAWYVCDCGCRDGVVETPRVSDDTPTPTPPCCDRTDHHHHIVFATGVDLPNCSICGTYPPGSFSIHRS